LFNRSTATAASDYCDANRGRFDDWAPTMDETDAFKREVVDNTKKALASKLAVISFMECEARIDGWLDRELMSKLALVLSLEEGRDEVVEGLDDGGGVDSKLAVILLTLIEVDADKSAKVAFEDVEVFATLDMAVAAAAAAAATLRAALILFCLL
jgi:hypothetical protein